MVAHPNLALVERSGLFFARASPPAFNGWRAFSFYNRPISRLLKDPMQITDRDITELIPYARNSRTHSDEQVAQIAGSIREFGWTNPILVDGENGIIAGHGRVLAARKLGMATVPVIELSHMTEAQKRAYIIADNKLALNAGWDEGLLALELGELKDSGFDINLTGFTGDELKSLQGLGGLPGGGEGKGSLSDRFMVAPFSVLNALEGWWQDRKRAWISLGIDSGQGKSSSMQKSMNDLLRKVSGESAATKDDDSIFDPVLCELAYRWFSPPKGIILDPFSGGSVRGIVASKLGRHYVGVDLREEQVFANRDQVAILNDNDPTPVWHCGDSRMIDRYCKGLSVDFIFSCPPYVDLEVYSDNPLDISNMNYEEFKVAYFDIIKKSCNLLRVNRFAAFVVGEVRDKKGNYYNFVNDTIHAFVDSGLNYYNEAILVTVCGSLSLRAGKYFETSRKLGKTHQNVLVFVKGDPKKAVEACGPVDVCDEVFAGLEEE